jgi:cytochrome c peroxidase
MIGDYVIDTLKKKFFMLIKQENHPNTPDITQEIDNIVEAIRELEKEYKTTQNEFDKYDNKQDTEDTENRKEEQPKCKPRQKRKGKDGAR